MAIAYRVKARMKGCGGYTSAMRPGWLGNPYPLGVYIIEQSLANYRGYLWNKIQNDKQFYLRFKKLKGQYIGCTCSLDQPCHVDIILEVLRSVLENEKELDKWWDVR
jgi:hypothetical protein